MISHPVLAESANLIEKTICEQSVLLPESDQFIIFKYNVYIYYQIHVFYLKSIVWSGPAGEHLIADKLYGGVGYVYRLTYLGGFSRT